MPCRSPSHARLLLARSFSTATCSPILDAPGKRKFPAPEFLRGGGGLRRSRLLAPSPRVRLTCAGAQPSELTAVRLGAVREPKSPRVDRTPGSRHRRRAAAWRGLTPASPCLATATLIRAISERAAL